MVSQLFLLEARIIFKASRILCFVFISSLCVNKLWAEGDTIRFVVKPKLCVLSNEEETCHDTLEILWSAHSLKSVCLFQSNKRLPLRCWENESNGTYAVEITTGEDIEFQLREISDKKLVVADSFEVIHDKPEYRRRRRNPWSFF